MDDEKLGYYGSGMCHLFAIACVRQCGGFFRVAENHGEIHKVEDGEEIPEVQHVYAVFQNGENYVAVDVFGVRPLHRLTDDLFDRYGCFDLEYMDVLDESALRSAYVCDEKNQERQLKAISDEAMARAEEEVAEILREHGIALSADSSPTPSF